MQKRETEGSSTFSCYKTLPVTVPRCRWSLSPINHSACPLQSLLCPWARARSCTRRQRRGRRVLVGAPSSCPAAPRQLRTQPVERRCCLGNKERPVVIQPRQCSGWATAVRHRHEVPDRTARRQLFTAVHVQRVKLGCGAQIPPPTHTYGHDIGGLSRRRVVLSGKRGGSEGTPNTHLRCGRWAQSTPCLRRRRRG